MSVDEFWSLVERVHIEGDGDMDQKCVALNAELRKLSPEEVVAFDDHFDAASARAYTWPLWAAAYIMNGGCGDDSFMDFRATLVSMGRDIFEQALDDPDSLADLDLDDGEEMVYEGYQYVPMQVLEDLAPGKEFPRSKSQHPHPREPSGERWDEDSVDEVCPRLAKKYG